MKFNPKIKNSDEELYKVIKMIRPDLLKNTYMLKAWAVKMKDREYNK